MGSDTYAGMVLVYTGVGAGPGGALVAEGAMKATAGAWLIGNVNKNVGNAGKRYQASSGGGSGGRKKPPNKENKPNENRRESNQSPNTSPDPSERKYVPNPKHDAPGGKVSPNPFGKDDVAGQKSLGEAYSSLETKQLYNLHNGKLVKFQPDGNGGFHPYSVKNSATEVPSEVLKKMLSDGKINSTEYKKLIKNKK